MQQPYHQILQQSAKSHSDFPDHASTENKIFVEAINIPETNMAFITPDLIAKSPPKQV